MYLAIVGGAAALATQQIEAIEDVWWEDLMPECLWKFRVKNFGPLIVAIDAHGNSLYKTSSSAPPSASARYNSKSSGATMENNSARWKATTAFSPFAAAPTCADGTAFATSQARRRRMLGAKKLSMNYVTIPPGGVAYAHIHVDFEVMLYILAGRVRHEFGPALEHALENEAGDFIFIELASPTKSSTHDSPGGRGSPRSDASEWENIVNFTRPPKPGSIMTKARGPAVMPVSRSSRPACLAGSV